jgi:hypothetical protein
MGAAPNAIPPLPTTPDATDQALVAARRARGLALFSLSGSTAAAFQSRTALGTQPQGGVASYGLPLQSLIGGGTQFGDDTGTQQAPSQNVGGTYAGGGQVIGGIKAQKGVTYGNDGSPNP